MITKQKIKLPEFKGKPLIEVPKYVPHVEFLGGEFGKAFLEEYNERVREDYNDNSNLKVLKYNDKQKIVTGSNSFAGSLVNRILFEQGLHTATQSELERILKLGILDLREFYEDSGIVLRDEQEPNSYLARYLIRQLDNTILPVMIPLKNLELRNDGNSPYGLAFNITGDVIPVPILNIGSGYFLPEDIDDETGLPKKLGEGNGYFYTRKTGLSRLYLDGDSDVDSGYEHLAYSNDGGRVVVVCGSAAQKNFDVLDIINKNYKTQLKELEERKARAEKEALAIMQGKK